jgi:hypothetical protein
MDIPASGATNTFLDSAQTQGQGRAALDQILQVLEQGFGLTQGEEELTVAAGTLSPAPTRQMMRLTHGAGSADLSSIQQASIPEGRLIHVRIKNAANVVVLKHGAGAQQLSMANGVDYALSLTTMGVVFQRRGTIWSEVWRAATPGLLTTATLSGTWAHSGGNSLRYRTVGLWCYVFGAVTNSSAISSSSTLFTLPAGFRPATEHHFHATIVKSGNDQPAAIKVTGAGVVSFEPLNGQGYATGDTLVLSFGFPILN